jgi:hypothetical protein
MHRLTPLNDIILHGNPAFPKTSDRMRKATSANINVALPASEIISLKADGLSSPPTSSDPMPSSVPVEIVSNAPGSSLCLPLSSSLQSLFFLESLNKSSTQQSQIHTRRLQQTEPCDMDISCSYDFWLWLEMQKLFTPVSATTHDPDVLQLLGKNFQYIFLFSIPYLVIKFIM